MAYNLPFVFMYSNLASWMKQIVDSSKVGTDTNFTKESFIFAIFNTCVSNMTQK